MNRNIGPQRARRIVADMLTSQVTLTELASKHGLDVIDLARWAGREQSRRSLSGLCDLANFQTQLLLSQYRVTAAHTLIHMANGKRRTGDGEAEEEDRDLVRKACADLLKMNVRPVEVEAVADEPAESPAAALKKLLYEDGDDDGVAG